MTIKYKYGLIGIALISMLGSVVHAQTQTGYRVPAGYDCGDGARVTNRMNFQIGTGSTFVMRYGTTTVTGSGTVGYMRGTDSAYPRWVWTPATNRMNFLDITLQQNGVDIAAYGNSAALAAAINDETGTNTVVFSSSPTINTPTLAGNSNFPSGIWNSSGSVGIGTVAPDELLEIGGTKQSIKNFGTDRIFETSTFASLDKPAFATYILSNGTTKNYYGIGQVSGGLGIVANDANAGNINFFTGGLTSTGGSVAERMRITNTGSVGIGETAPGSKLSVSGGGSFGAAYDTTAAPTNGLIVEGNVGIGTTTPNNILTLPIASATDPIADAWTVHCLADYKNIGTETVEMIQLSANDKIKTTPISSFTKKALISDEEAEREVKQKYQDKIRESAKADLELYTAETGVSMRDNSYVDELVNSMWETKADRLTLVDANRQKLVAEKKALPKFQRQQYGIVAEDAPPEAQVLREDGGLQGVDPYALIGILWANAQSQEIRISTLEAEIEKLKTILNP